MVASAFNLARELRRQLEAVYGPRLVDVIVYGSQARGDADPESDIDVMIVLRGEVDAAQEIGRTGAIVAGLSLREDVLISPIFMSAARYAAEARSLLINVRREGIHV